MSGVLQAGFLGSVSANKIKFEREGKRNLYYVYLSVLYYLKPFNEGTAVFGLTSAL